MNLNTALMLFPFKSLLSTLYILFPYTNQNGPQKEEIKIEYNSKKRNINDTWIKTFASFLGRIKTFEWNNSFEHLPKDGTETEDHILLWLANDEFEKDFFTVPRFSQRKRSQT